MIMERWEELPLLSLARIVQERPNIDIRKLLLAIRDGELDVYFFADSDLIFAEEPESKLKIEWTYEDPGGPTSIVQEVWGSSPESELSGPVVVKILDHYQLAQILLEELFTRGTSGLIDVDFGFRPLTYTDGVRKLVNVDTPRDPRAFNPVPKEELDRVLHSGEGPTPLCYRERSSLNLDSWELLISEDDLTTLEGKGGTREQQRTPGYGAAMAPHWGEGLRKLIVLANRLWGEHAVDPTDETTFPFNTDVIQEIQAQGFNERVAKNIAVAIRPDWGKAMVRKKGKTRGTPETQEPA